MSSDELPVELYVVLDTTTRSVTTQRNTGEPFEPPLLLAQFLYRVQANLPLPSPQGEGSVERELIAAFSRGALVQLCHELGYEVDIARTQLEPPLARWALRKKSR